MPNTRIDLFKLVAAILLALAPAIGWPQARLEREGVVMYWGLVPAALVSQRHAQDEMHGVVPRDDGLNHHLVVALFRRDGARITDAVVRAQLHESGIEDERPKYLTPMTIDGQVSYGQFFSAAKGGPYKFRVLVRLADRAGEIEFAVSAWSPIAVNAESDGNDHTGSGVNCASPRTFRWQL